MYSLETLQAAHSVVSRAIERISDYRRWATHDLALTAAGDSTIPWGPKAETWCAWGALAAEHGRGLRRSVVYRCIQHTITETPGYKEWKLEELRVLKGRIALHEGAIQLFPEWFTDSPPPAPPVGNPLTPFAYITNTNDKKGWNPAMAALEEVRDALEAQLELHGTMALASVPTLSPCEVEDMAESMAESMAEALTPC